MAMRWPSHCFSSGFIDLPVMPCDRRAARAASGTAAARSCSRAAAAAQPRRALRCASVRGGRTPRTAKGCGTR
eukprot:2585819-Prymnesium_polylepis.1